MKILKINLIAFLLAFASLSSQVPQTVSFQGYLADETGKPLADGEYTVTVNLYENIDDENPQWSSGPLNVNTTMGIFSVLLGDEGQPRLPLFSKPFFAGVMMNKQELIDRIAVSSVPYSLYAERAKTAESVLMPPMPVGSVISYAGFSETLPDDWMVCNGRTMISKDYPALYKAIGTSWGDGTNDRSMETDFNLPDLRGQFLRGVDSGAGVDPDARFRMNKYPGGNTGDSVGTYQGDARTGIQDKPFGGETSFSMVPDIQTKETTYSLSAGSENRPKNASVYFIIKVK